MGIGKDVGIGGTFSGTGASLVWGYLGHGASNHGSEGDTGAAPCFLTSFKSINIWFFYVNCTRADRGRFSASDIAAECNGIDVAVVAQKSPRRE